MIKFFLGFFLAASPFLLGADEDPRRNMFLPPDAKIENDAFTIVSSDEYSVILKFTAESDLKEVLIELSGKAVLTLSFGEKKDLLPKLSDKLQLDSMLKIEKIIREKDKVVFACGGSKIEKCFTFRLIDLTKGFYFTLIFSEVGHLLNYNVRDDSKKIYFGPLYLNVKKNEDYLVLIFKPNFRVLKIATNKREEIIELDNSSTDFNLFKGIRDLLIENAALRSDKNHANAEKLDEVSKSLMKLSEELSLIVRWDGASYFIRPEINR